MGAIAAPILPGKLDGWTQWMNDLNGPRNEEFLKFNARHGLTTHRAWLQTAPDGSSLVIAVTEGPGSETFMADVATSTDPFDADFRDHLTAAHGIDFKSPPPPPAELKLGGGN